MDDKPHFRHDCTRCEFLGHFEGHDLYYCNPDPTVIARWSDDGPDYYSDLHFVATNRYLHEAYRRALALGRYLGLYKPTLRDEPFLSGDQD